MSLARQDDNAELRPSSLAGPDSSSSVVSHAHDPQHSVCAKTFRATSDTRSTFSEASNRTNCVSLAPATPSPIQAGAIVPRRRFQRGNIIIRGKTPQRYGMYREDVLKSDGTVKRVRRCVLLGPVSTLSERAAWKVLQPYLDLVNDATKMPSKSGVTLEAFVKEWRTNVAVNLKASTVRAAESHLRAHILPKLGSHTLLEINTKAV